MYVQFGFLPETIPWTIISPVEFSDRGDINDRFIKCNLEPEKLFTYIRLCVSLIYKLLDQNTDAFLRDCFKVSEFYIS